MALVIVESPNKIPKIKKVLGAEYEVISSVGHIMDLSKKKLGVELPDFTPVYEISKGKNDVVSNIKRSAKKHDDIYIATDADREGEAIAFNILSLLPKHGKNIKRVVFNEITKKEIMNGINNPIGFKQEVFEAQQARRITDRFVGFKVSPVMWSKGLKGTSAGRVQSAALKFIVDKEKEIRAFVSEEYWSISADTEKGFEANFVTLDGKKFVPKSKEETKDTLSKLNGPLIVTSYEKKTRSKKPPQPFVTASMQRAAGAKFKWSAKRTMDTAQSLFSQGLITYHRTDSTRCSPEKVDLIRKKIIEKLGKKYLSKTPNLYGPKEAAQDAHEAIRPTFEITPETLLADEKKLLNLIRNRFMASQMAHAKFDAAKIELESGSLGFKTTGSVVQFDGFLKVYGSTGNDVLLPKLSVGDKIRVKKYKPKQHFTKAPPRFSESAFIERLEKEGIGRPATYASLVETLLKRGYVNRKGTTMHGTEIGILVCDYLEEHFQNITDTKMTADMEKNLDDIAKGKKTVKSILTQFNDSLEKDIFKAKKSESRSAFETDHKCTECNDGSKMVRKVSDKEVFLGCENWPKCGHTYSINEDGELVAKEVETGIPCPDCGSKIIKRNGKFGEFWACSAYQVCNWKGKLDKDGNPILKNGAQTTDQECPECKKGMLRKRTGKFGDFLGCQNYPTCTFTAKLDGEGNIVVKSKKKKKPVKKTGKKCPKCNKNELVEREGRYGTFVACSGYPKCKHIVK